MKLLAVTVLVIVFSGNSLCAPGLRMAPTHLSLMSNDENNPSVKDKKPLIPPTSTAKPASSTTNLPASTAKSLSYKEFVASGGNRTSLLRGDLLLEKPENVSSPTERPSYKEFVAAGGNRTSLLRGDLLVQRPENVSDLPARLNCGSDLEENNWQLDDKEKHARKHGSNEGRFHKGGPRSMGNPMLWKHHGPKHWPKEESSNIIFSSNSLPENQVIIIADNADTHCHHHHGHHPKPHPHLPSDTCNIVPNAAYADIMSSNLNINDTIVIVAGTTSFPNNITAILANISSLSSLSRKVNIFISTIPIKSDVTPVNRYAINKANEMIRGVGKTVPSINVLDLEGLYNSFIKYDLPNWGADQMCRWVQDQVKRMYNMSDTDVLSSGNLSLQPGMLMKHVSRSIAMGEPDVSQEEDGEACEDVAEDENNTEEYDEDGGGNYDGEEENNEYGEEENYEDDHNEEDIKGAGEDEYEEDM